VSEVDGTASDADDYAAEDAALDAAVDGGRAHAVLAYLASQIVDDRDAVVIETGETRHGVKLSLRVASEDMGKVIGRRGRVAQSIRGVVAAAGAKDGIDVLVDIVD
jgi:predicted RNA-binding protein YlqC (UPF0109 family)